MPESISALSLHLTHNLSTGRMSVEILASESGTLVTQVAQDCSPFWEAEDIVLFCRGVVGNWLRPAFPLDSEAVHDMIP